jgi:hypothetical protein
MRPDLERVIRLTMKRIPPAAKPLYDGGASLAGT